MKKLNILIFTLIFCAYLPAYSLNCEEGDQEIFMAAEDFFDEIQFQSLSEEALNQGEKPRLNVFLDRPSFRMYEDWMRVYLSVTNPGTMLKCDIVFALYHIPTGALEGKLWFFPNWDERLNTIRITFPAGSIITKKRIVLTPVPSLWPGTPPITEPGEYTWAAGLFNPSSLDLVSDISTATIQVIEPMTPLSFPQEPATDPYIIVSTDKSNYTLYDENDMEVYLEAGNPGPALPVDIVFALYHHPQGAINPVLWFFPDWLDSYQVTATLVLPQDFILERTKVLDVHVPSLVPNSPPVIETGEYIWATVLAKPHTLDFLTEISTASVMVEPAIPK